MLLLSFKTNEPRIVAKNNEIIADFIMKRVTSVNLIRLQILCTHVTHVTYEIIQTTDLHTLADISMQLF